MPTTIEGTGITTGTLSTTNEAISTAELGNGAIIQVVTCIKNDTWYENSVAEGAFSGVVTGLTQAFTCSTSSNKVLITGHVFAYNAVKGSWGAGLVITADGSTIDAATGNARGSRSRLHSLGQTSHLGANIPVNYLHSPASTSAITYGVKLWNGHTSSQNMIVNYPSSDDTDNNNGICMASSLTFMEIVA